MKYVSIRFKPCAAYSLVQEPMNGYSDKIVDTGSMNLPGFVNLHKELKKASSPEKTQNLVNDYLKTHIKTKEFIRPRVFAAMQKMKTLKSDAFIKEMASEAGITVKHLNALFNKFV